MSAPLPSNLAVDTNLCDFLLPAMGEGYLRSESFAGVSPELYAKREAAYEQKADALASQLGRLSPASNQKGGHSQSGQSEWAVPGATSTLD